MNFCFESWLDETDVMNRMPDWHLAQKRVSHVKQIEHRNPGNYWVDLVDAT